MKCRAFTTLLLAQAVGLVWPSSAVTLQVANVGIWNNTPRDIFGISIMHKYSDVYKDNNTWASVPRNSKSSTTFQVHYNTGAFTTGVDWWLASWYYSPLTDANGAIQLYYTAPQNLRSIFDFFEATGIVEAVITAVVLAARRKTKVDETNSINAAKAFANAVLNREETDGFKRCFLTSDDTTATTWIRINDDSTVDIIPGSSSQCNTLVASKLMVMPAPSPTPTPSCRPGPPKGRCISMPPR